MLILDESHGATLTFDHFPQGLLSHNAKVYVGARDEEKVRKAIQDLKAETGKEGIWLELDLADLHSVRKADEDFKSKEKQLHILFNNAFVVNSLSFVLVEA